MPTAPTSWTGTTWQGNYGPSGQLYYYGGRPFKSPEELYAALGQPMDPNGNLPYGTTVYSQGYSSGMSPWDTSVQNNPYGPLDQISGPTASLYANASTPGAASTTPPMPAASPGAATPALAGTTGTTSPTSAMATPTSGPQATPTGGPTGTGTTTPNTTGTVGTPAGNYLPGPNSTTPADVFNPLDDPRQSVYRALVANGYNPEVPTWGINQLLKRASDIAWGAAGRTAWGGNPDVITTPGALQDYMNSLVGQATSGASGIMPTAQQGQDYLGAINTLMNGTNRSQGATYLSQLIGANPDAAAGLAERLRYGAFAPGVRSALGGPLQNFGTRFSQFTETPEGFATATTHNALDILLNNLIPGYRPLF